MSNCSEEEVTFRVVMTDASSKEIPLSTSATKLFELKQMLAQNEYFGARAPVERQRLFHLGRELKSGGRSLCNLGLGRFNNRIIHLCLRPESGKSSSNKSARDATAGSRKRNREAPTQQQSHRRPLQRRNPAETIDIYNEQIQPLRTNPLSSATTRPVVSTNNASNTGGTNSAIAIDLVDSSDDEVEVIEVL